MQYRAIRAFFCLFCILNAEMNVGTCSKLRRRYYKERTADLQPHNMKPLGKVITDIGRTICQALCARQSTGFAWSPSTNRCQLVQDQGGSQGGELEAPHRYDLYIAETKDDSFTCESDHATIPELQTYFVDCK